MRIELRIDRLVLDGLGAFSPDELVTSITRELRLVLGRDLSLAPVTARPAVSVPRLQTTLALPPAGASSSSAGQAIGASLASAVTSSQAFPRARGQR